MTEPFFGSAQPFWGPLPSSGLGWAGSPLPVGNIGPGAATPMPSSVIGYGAVPPLAVGGNLSAFGAFPVPAAVMPGITASTLVAAVAMRRGQPAVPASDAEIEDFLYDALELIPGTSEAEVRCEAGRVTLTGSVPHKRQKHDVGEIAWAIPSVADVQNSVTIAGRRRGRASGRENEAQTSGPVRKHA
jgi:hypothetical protein